MGAQDTAEKPAVAGDDGKWTKCEEPAAVDHGKVRCKKDTCIVKCDDGFMLDGAGKSKCVKGDDDTFAFNKELGACVACPAEGCPEMEKPDKPPVFGDDGKWTKCEEPTAVENGKVKC